MPPMSAAAALCAQMGALMAAAGHAFAAAVLVGAGFSTWKIAIDHFVLVPRELLRLKQSLRGHSFLWHVGAIPAIQLRT